MAPTKARTAGQSAHTSSWAFLRRVACDPDLLPVTAAVLLAVEVLINLAIIWNVKYTEIDWEAYMSEVGGPLKGNYNYTELGGGTGPLVYPAGFVYVYALFFQMTGGGADIRAAQYLFLAVYLLHLLLVLGVYAKTRSTPPWAVALLTFTSYRVHSIFVLRLFNDPIAMLFLYASIICFTADRWVIGSALFRLGGRFSPSNLHCCLG